MKKHCNFYIILIFLIFSQIKVKAQSFIALDNAGNLYQITITASGCAFTSLTYATSCMAGNSPLSIALDGNILYTVDNKGNLYKSILGSATCSKIGVFTFNTASKNTIYGLTVDKNGLIYAASGGEISTFNPTTSTLTKLTGKFPFGYLVGGDLLFYLGNLYLPTKTGQLLQVDLNNLANSSVFLTFTSPSVFGFSSVSVPCSNNQIYALSTQSATSTDIVPLNMNNQTQGGIICNLPFQIYDAASVSESGAYVPPKLVTNDQTVCSPSTVDLTAPAITAGSTSDLITFSYWQDVAITIPYTTPTTATNGTYYIVGSTASGCKDTGKVIVTVNPINTITLTSAAGTNAQKVCINKQITNITYATTGATGATITGLPTGVSGSWAADVITISGTPTISAGSPFTYTINLTGGCAIAAITGTLTVTPINTITLTSATGTNAQKVCINKQITNITYATTGATGATITGLPTGVSGSWAADVVTISGTPTISAGSPFTYTINLTGGCAIADITGTLTVNPINTITLTSAAGTNAQKVCINKQITNITYATTGATGATITGLPTGVTGSWAADVITISGTPTISTGSPFTYTINLTGGCAIADITGTLTVNPINTITLTSAAGTNAQKVCINKQITNITYATTGATGATITGLPTGVTGSWAADVVTISGTPTISAGSPFTYTINLTGGCAIADITGTLTVNPINTITLTSAASTNAQKICINKQITNITYATTGATGATITGLPTGVTGSWAADVITISGTPTISAGSPFTYTINLTGGCAIAAITGTLTVNPINTITLTSAAGTNAQKICINKQITNITYATTGATGATITGLPTGVSGSWAANVITISGTPTITAGSPFTYTINLTGGCAIADITGTLTVNPINTITLTSAAGTNAQKVCINKQITNITYATTGATGATITGLPTGVSGSWAADVITISGTPTISAGSPFTYTINLTGGCAIADITGTLTVNPINTITLTSAAGTNAQKVCINKQITNITYATTGATGATITGLPTGVSGSWAADVITISGTPTISAGSPFTYTINLTGGCAIADITGTLTVNPINTITLTSAAGTNAQKVCINKQITNITYATTGATGATITGLPTGVSGSWAADVITISGTPTISAGSPFTYTINLTGGCAIAAITGTLTVNPLPTAPSVSETTAPTCAIPKGVITISAPIGANFTYSNNNGAYQAAVIFSGLTPASANSFIVKNITTGCISSATSLTISTIPGAPAAPTITNNSRCGNGIVNLSATGVAGTTLKWYSDIALTTLVNTGTTYSPSLTTTTDYYVIAVNATGCTSGATKVTGTINSTSTPVTGISYKPNDFCLNSATNPTLTTVTGFTTGGVYTATPAGLSINAATGAINIAASLAGNYTITYTVASSGCAVANNSIASININSIITPNTNFSYSSNSICVNGSNPTINPAVGFTAGGVYSVSPTGLSINTATGAINVASSTPSLTPYTITYTVAASGCMIAKSGTTTVTINAAPNKPSVSFVTPTCANPSGTINVSPLVAGLTYSNDGVNYNATGVFTNILQGAAYSITAKNVAGCASTATTGNMALAPNAPIKPTVTITQPTCLVATATLTATSSDANITYSNDGINYTNTTGIFTNIAASATYSITTKNAAGCVSPANAGTINMQPVTPAPVLTVVNNCGSSSITASNFTGTLIWSDGGTGNPRNYTIATNNISVIQQTNAGCKSASSNIVSAAPKLIPTPSTKSITTCKEYLWNGKTYSTTGVYSILIPVNGKCDSVAKLDLKIVPPTPSTKIVYACPDELPYKWNGKQYVTEGIYQIIIKNNQGCDSSATLNLKLLISCKDIYFPSAFSPNGDGINDTFGPLGDLNSIKNYTFSIFNRYGEIVFKSTNPYEKWDGKYLASLSANYTYVWFATYDYRGATKVQKGNVVIVK